MRRTQQPPSRTQISARDLGALLQIGPERLRHLKAEGFIKDRKGHYTIELGVTGYIEFLKSRIKQARRTANGADPSLLSIDLSELFESDEDAVGEDRNSSG